MANCEIESGGLTTEEFKSRQLKYGKNELTSQKRENFVKKVFHAICEPMFLLLLVAAVIYFILGEPRDGVIMLCSVIGILSIDIIQKWKTDKTLSALKDLSAPHVKVLRDGKEIQIASVDLVPDDIMMIYEGVKIPADGFVVSCNDLCVDESSLTGEAERVWKVSTENSVCSHDYWRKDYCYAGTLVLHGSAVVCVDKIGKATEYGKIGVNVSEGSKKSAPLQLQVGSLVKLCVGIAAVLFALVSVVTWFNISSYLFHDRLIGSVLSGVTLSMALIPEEFPVILTVFLSMGAWRLAKKESLVRRLSSVETLGAVSVLCVDKTGTLTMNQMTVQEVWTANSGDGGSGDKVSLSKIMGLACETSAYDPMEKAMLDYCEKLGISTQCLFDDSVMLAEYAFTPELKMMGHVWRHNDEIVIVAKGSPERLLTICHLTENERVLVENKIYEMSQQGLRVIAVATATLYSEIDIPKNLVDCTLTLCGLIGLVDPPRETVKNDLAICSKAGIRVVMITGDNGVTAAAIAKKIGMKNYDNIITGDELEKMSEDDLRESVTKVNIFSRVTPEHKLRIVKAFKDNGEIVAMTGDGVNDAPALKYADIGIAMGKRGSEVSREAADIILMNDNFSTIVDTVKDGRRIYDNIRKAISYVFTIHVPVALVTLFAPLLGIYPTSLLLLPIHIVLLELIIDPTCSIVLERQPAETNIMKRQPRNPKERLLNAKTLAKCLMQGITIFAASFGLYYYTLTQNHVDAYVARSMGFAVIIIANIFLIQVNSSNTDNIFTSIKRLSKDKVMWTANILIIIGLFTMLYSPLNSFLKLAPLSIAQLLSVLGVAAASILWYEIVKIIKKRLKKMRVFTYR